MNDQDQQNSPTAKAADYRAMLQGFIWRVMEDDHIVAFKAIKSCQDQSERRLLIDLTREVAVTERDEDVLVWLSRIVGDQE